MKERKLYLLVKYVYLDVQAYDFFSKRSRLHDCNVDGINVISAWIWLQTRQTFNHNVKGKRKKEWKL